jgi:hypothetical protein
MLSGFEGAGRAETLGADRLGLAGAVPLSGLRKASGGNREKQSRCIVFSREHSRAVAVPTASGLTCTI